MKRNKLIGVILCAGKGTRIKKLPFKKPKTLLEILGKSIINYQIEMLIKSGIKDLIIVIGKNGNHIKNNIISKNYSKTNIKFINDKNPKGISSSLDKVKNYVKNSFILFLGDIFTDKVYLEKMIKKFNDTKSSCVIASTKESNLDIIKKNFTVHISKNSIVTKVIEKPKIPKSNIKGVGIYMFKKDVFNSIKYVSKHKDVKKRFDITEVIQNLIEREKVVTNSLCVKNDFNINEPKDLWKLNFKKLGKKNNFISKNCKIGKNFKIQKSIIGENVNIGNNVKIKNSIIFSNSKISDDSLIKNRIVTQYGYLMI